MRPPSDGGLKSNRVNVSNIDAYTEYFSLKKHIENIFVFFYELCLFDWPLKEIYNRFSKLKPLLFSVEIPSNLDQHQCRKKFDYNFSLTNRLYNIIC